MALRDIKNNKAYIARQQGASVIPPAVSPTGAKLVGEGKQWSSASPDGFYDSMESLQNADTNTAIFTGGKTSAKSTSTVSPTISTKTSPYNNAGAGYKSNVSKNGGITVKKDLGYDLTDFGDVNTLGNKYKGQGYSIPTFGENIDFTKVPQLGEAGQGFDRFGKQAELMEAQTPGFLNKRNDAYLAELARTNPDFNILDEASQKQAISELLQKRDVKGELFSGSKGQQDVLNTINSIYNRIGQGKSQNQLMNEKATQLYDKEQGNIDSMYQAEKNNFLKAGAVEDRFTNFNEVESKIQNTLLAAGQHRADNLYTGTPNDAQIAEIAQGLGQDFATTKKILEGRGYEDLQLQDEFNKEASQGYDRNMQDLEVNKQRTEEDADLQHQRTQAVLDQQIEDTKLQMQQDLAMGEKAGALSGAVRSSGYMDALGAIKSQYMKNIGRLQERKARDTEDIVQNKKRISEVYELNATRNKEDLNSTLKSIKMKAGLEMSQYLNEYAPSSTELERKLNDITNKYGLLSQEAFGKWRENITGITDVMTYDTEKIMELQQKKQTLQQVTVGNLLADNGMALAGLSKNELQSMVQNGTISNADYSAMTGYMQSLGIATLQSKGVPTQEDISLYTSLLDSGVSPQQAITTVMSKNPSRYTGADAKDRFMTVGSGSNIFDASTGQFVSAPGGAGATQASYTGPTVPPATPEKINASYSKYMNIPDGSKVRNGRCGEFVNDYIKEATGIGNNMFVDPINIRATQTNSSTPSVGSVVIMNSSGSPEATKYGHVAIVQSVNNDGTITIKEQNGANPKKVGTRKIPSTNANIVGYYNPQLGLQSGGGDQEMRVLSLVQGLGGTEGERAKFADNILKLSNRKGISLEDAKKELGYKSGDDVEFAKSRKEQFTNITKSSDAVTKGKQALTVLNNKQTAIGDVAAIVGFLKTIDPNSVARESEVDSVENARGILDTFSNTFAKLDSGKKLTDTQRKELKDTIGFIVKAYEDNLSSFVTDTVQEFDGRGLDASVYIPKATLNKYNVTQEKIQKNVAPAQTLLNTQLQQAQAKKTGTSNTTNTSTFANWKKSKGL